MAAQAWCGMGASGTRVYNMYISTTNSPYVWTLVSSTTKQQFNVDGLEPGKFYYFAVSAIGSTTESSKADQLK
ncbi:MAG: hypothetical protein IPL64_12170 [Flavobacteriales bacterium]|nr:hypothetical protein [Flavobacteriales bacterium]